MRNTMVQRGAYDRPLVVSVRESQAIDAISRSGNRTPSHWVLALGIRSKFCFVLIKKINYKKQSKLMIHKLWVEL